MNIRNFKEALPYLVKAELTPFIWGHAGKGKTEVVKQYAKEMGYQFFALYLGTQSDVGDILGLADFKRDKDGTVLATKFATPEWLYNAIEYCIENPESGAIIFLDEFNRGRKDIQAGMFALALDKTFHTIKLPKNCHIIAAGNPPTDEYNVTDVSDTALMARFVHIKLEPSFDEWTEFAKHNEVDNTLLGFIKEQPELLEETRSEFNLPVKVDRRAWSRLDKLFKLNTPWHLLQSLMVGIVGIERTVAYEQYLQKADKPLSGEDVLSGKGLKQLTNWSDPTNTMSSLLNLTRDNVQETIKSRTVDLTNEEKKNLMAFITTIPKDVVFPLVQNLIFDRNAVGFKVFKNFFDDPNYSQVMLDLIKPLMANKKTDAA